MITIDWSEMSFEYGFSGSESTLSTGFSSGSPREKWGVGSREALTESSSGHGTAACSSSHSESSELRVSFSLLDERSEIAETTET